MSKFEEIDINRSKWFVQPLTKLIKNQRYLYGQIIILERERDNYPEVLARMEKIEEDIKLLKHRTLVILKKLNGVETSES